MVKGLDVFRDRFKALADRYVLIGGTACDLILEEAGLRFRATKDLDIVLCIESVDAQFAQTFWAFVKAGGYGIQESAQGKGRFYRFRKPANEAYPSMLELFPAPLRLCLSPRAVISRLFRSATRFPAFRRSSWTRITTAGSKRDEE